MDYYIDLQLQADEEIPIYFIRNKLFTKLHKALHDLKQSEIGVSFPRYQEKLGDVIRIHGSENHLQTLQQTNWIGGLSGYCSISEILSVPEQVSAYRVISRVQQNMSNSKLKRLLKRSSITEEEAKQYRAKMFTKGLDNPYIELVSGSNGHRHRRYIEFGELVGTPVAGEFDQFGLSKTATVPVF